MIYWKVESLPVIVFIAEAFGIEVDVFFATGDLGHGFGVDVDITTSTVNLAIPVHCYLVLLRCGAYEHVPVGIRQLFINTCQRPRLFREIQRDLHLFFLLLENPQIIFRVSDLALACDDSV